MRIYLPSTVSELGAQAGLTPRLVHAVTPALRAALPEEDDEGLEYAAQLLAADDSLDRIEPGKTGLRRVVVAADVPEAVVESLDADEADAPSLVRLTVTVGWDDVACAHIDEAAAEKDVVAAVRGNEDAVDRLVERDLLWYDVTELGRLATTLTR